uniref:Putative secreted protein n=1 Tax=Amblyomma triste TaxID=251400 RepID=A0A023G052_AMBTT
MNLITITLSGCILFALVHPMGTCRSCCGSCTKPMCMDKDTADGNSNRYFPIKGKCEVRSSTRHCKGKFYTEKKECENCCKSFLSSKVKQ